MIEALKSKVRIYPIPLNRTIVQTNIWGAEFTLRNCVKSAERGQVFIVAGCLTRIASHLFQTLYALHETYFLTEKRIREDEQTFALKPRDFRARMEQILCSIRSTRDDLMEAVPKTEMLFEELKALCGVLYRPRFE